MKCAQINVDDYDGPSCFVSANPKARKDHKCCECRRVIKKGEIYRRESGIWDGHPDRYKTCVDCLSIRNSFFKYGHLYQNTLDSLHEHINMCGGDISSECIVDLTDKARDCVCDMIQEQWTDNE